MKRNMRFLLMPVLILSLLLIGAGCAANTPAASPSQSSAPTESAIPSPAPSTGPEDTSSPSAALSPSTEPSSSPTAQASPSPSSAPSPSDASSPSVAPSAKPSPSVKPSPASTGDLSSPGWALMEGESLGGIYYHMSESALTALIGAPESKSDTMNWGADGLDHTDWNYPTQGLKINMVKQPDDVEGSVFMITATAPCALETKRGIKIGDTKEAVLAAYAKAYNADESDEYSLVFGTLYGGIIMDIENGLVTRIFIGAAAE